MEEERRNSEELRNGLEKEREELRAKLKDATNEVRGQSRPIESGFSADNALNKFIYHRCNMRCAVLSDL